MLRHRTTAHGGPIHGGVQVDSNTKHVLDPMDRLNELFYGTVLALTLTGTLRVTGQGQRDASTALWAVVGCSIGWGLVDGIMYVYGSAASRNRNYRLLRSIRADPTVARDRIMASMPPVVADALPSTEWNRIVDAIGTLPAQSNWHLKRDDILGGVAIFFLANAALLPLAAPYVLVANHDAARHVSDAVALVMLCGCGLGLAHYTGERPLTAVIRCVGVGLALVAAIMALGG